jgi:hypothetical protein
MQALLGFLFPVENEEARKGLRKGNADFGKRSFLIKATFESGLSSILKELPHSIALYVPLAYCNVIRSCRSLQGQTSS